MKPLQEYLTESSNIKTTIINPNSKEDEKEITSWLRKEKIKFGTETEEDDEEDMPAQIVVTDKINLSALKKHNKNFDHFENE